MAFNEKLQLENVKRLMIAKAKLGDLPCSRGCDKSPDRYDNDSQMYVIFMAEDSFTPSLPML